MPVCWMLVWATTSRGIAAKAFYDFVGLTKSVNFQNQISTTGTSSLLDAIMTNFAPNYLCLCSVLGSSDHCFCQCQYRSGYCNGTTSMMQNMAVHTDQLAGIAICPFTKGLIGPLSPQNLIFIPPGNTYTKDCFLSCIRLFSLACGCHIHNPHGPGTLTLMERQKWSSSLLSQNGKLT